ncbi:MAG TPA: molybdopterin molybdotransferase MoeA, partial [Candidatus Poseidoniales archaeon]|nr:molybdopterin molybdotransferase MoeA [Candidatus Poseidoniales archaeon]
MERWVDLARARELTADLVIERKHESIPLTSAHGHVLAQDVIADRDDPHADLSAMDGFAVIASSTLLATPNKPVQLTVQDTIFAGTGGDIPELSDGHAIRIMTGGRVPIGTTGIVLIEHTELDEKGRLLVHHPGKDHIRRQGEYHRFGETILQKGHRINAATIATLATVGLTEVRIFTPLRIGVLPTGDELVEPAQPVAPGQIRESNSWAIAARLRALGHNAERLSPQSDHLDELRSRLDNLAQTYDLIITSGGVSMGDADFVRHLMLEEG